MKKQFIVPAVIAMAFHAVVLFGFRAPPAIVSPPVDKPTALDGPPPIPVTIDEPPPVEDPSENKEERARKGTEDFRPQGDEPPSRPKPDDIVIDMPPISPHRPVDSRIIPPGVPGDPKGDDEGDSTRSGRPFDVSKLDNSPRARVQVGPVYPAEARMRGLAGEVLVAFTVDEEGRVVSPRVVRSTDAIFDEAARRAVAKWRFEPGRRQGRVVRFSMAVPMVFRVTE